MSSIGKRQHSLWSIRGRQLALRDRPLIMGVLNVTPDSFSDGGLYNTVESALRHVEAMLEEGADIIDVGGESTRPGASTVSPGEECRRVLPVISAVVRRFDVPLSIDTSKAVVARQALLAGAHIVNDIGGLSRDPDMARTVAELNAGVVIMHMRGTPETMQSEPTYADLLAEIVTFLRAQVSCAVAAGVGRSQIAIDPGIGFGKTWEQNWQLLCGLDCFSAIGLPILVGTSRKRFLRELVGPDRTDLEAATVATSVAAGLSGAAVVRVHDVRAHRVAMRVVERLRAAGS